MDGLIFTVAEVRNVFDPAQSRITTHRWMPGIALAEVAARSTIPGPVVVCRNGGDVETHLAAFVDPGDFVSIVPEVHGPVLAFLPAVAGLAASAAIGGTMGMIVGSLITMVGGLLLNSLMSNTPDANKANADKSPTYGFDNINPSREGFPWPVYFGESIITPVKLGEYVSTDEDSNQTYHGLFAVGRGQADGTIPASDIYINDELLTSFKKYTVNSSTGGNNPAPNSFPNFAKIHQYRSFSRPLEPNTVEVQALLHCNGEDASTTIVDESGKHVWTCAGSAALSTTDPFLGSACLDVSSAGSSICTASPVFAWDKSVAFELRFRVPDLNDRGFAGGEYRAGSTLIGWWGIACKGGHLVLHLVGRTYDPETDAWSYKLLVEIDAAVTLTAGTWHHLCLQTRQRGGGAQLYLDGAAIGSDSIDPGEETFVGGAIITHTEIGHASLLDPATLAKLNYDGLCKIDEVRIVTGVRPDSEEWRGTGPEFGPAYEWAGFTPPAAELDVLQFDTSETIATLSVVDRCMVVISAPALYLYDSEGTLRAFTVQFALRYRRIGDTAWTSSAITFSDASTQAVRRQYELVYPGRGKYEVQLERLTPKNDSDRAANDTSWTALDEILDEELLYPNTQVLELNIRAAERLQGSAPTVRVVGRRTSVIVPTYDGLGAQAVNPANPAWAAYAVLTDNLSGPGLDPSRRIDRASHEEWAAWCDGLVGGQPRARFNGVFDTSMSVQQALRYIYDVGRVSEITVGLKIAWAVEKPGQMRHLFGSANTDPKSHNLTFIQRSGRADVLEMEFTNKTRGWRRDSVPVTSSTFDTLTTPAISQTIFLRGCNDRDEARRHGLIKMRMTELLDRQITFRAGLETVTCRPGHICHFTHDGNRMFSSGRVRAVIGGAVLLDRVVCLPSAVYAGIAKIWVRTCEDVVLSADVTGPFDTGTNTFSVSTALPGVNADYPDSLDPFALGRATNEIYAYRILDISPPGQDLKSQVQAIEYRDDVYYHPDYVDAI